ncbi:MAG: hypothetical protein F4X91_04515 [Nitrospinae bacterium]|nr:hypothetical protein [Nitrospinota bacterium]
MLGLEATFQPAADIRDFTLKTYSKVDRQTRRRLGLWLLADAEIACSMNHNQIMREVVENGLNVF